MIYAFTGKTGSGKTYLMVKEAYKQWLFGRKIYSNTHLDFKNKLNKYVEWFYSEILPKYNPGQIVYFENIEEIIDAREGLIIFDEAQVLFNARNWESLPDEFQYKLQQHRKHELDLFCTTQNMGCIDISYRRLVQKWIHCENIWQWGGSPRIKLGIFRMNEKDIDKLYNSVDDLLTPNINSKLFFIHFWSKQLYDTMYDIGFKRFKSLCLTFLDEQLNKTSQFYIIPKKMKLKDAQSALSLWKSALGLKTSKNWK